MSPATLYECDNDLQEGSQGAMSRVALVSGSRCGGWKAQAEVVVRRVKQAREIQAMGLPQQLRGARYKPRQHKLLVGCIAANAQAEASTALPCKAGSIPTSVAPVPGTKSLPAAPKSAQVQRLKQQQCLHSTAVLVPPDLLYQALGPHTAALLQLKHQGAAATDTHSNPNSSPEPSSWELFAKQLIGGSSCWAGSPDASLTAVSDAEDALALTTVSAAPAAGDPRAGSTTAPGLVQLSGCSAKLLNSRQVDRHDKYKQQPSSSPAAVPGLVPANETTGGNLWLSEVKAWAAQAKALEASRKQQQRQRPAATARSQLPSQQQDLQLPEGVSKQVAKGCTKGAVGTSRPPVASSGAASPSQSGHLKAATSRYSKRSGRPSAAPSTAVVPAGMDTPDSATGDRVPGVTVGKAAQATDAGQIGGAAAAAEAASSCSGLQQHTPHLFQEGQLAGGRSCQQTGQELSRVMKPPSPALSLASPGAVPDDGSTSCINDEEGLMAVTGVDAAPDKHHGEGYSDEDDESAARHLAAAVPAELWTYDEATGCYWLPLAAVAAAVAATDDADTDVGTDFSSWCGDSVIGAALAADDLQQQAQEQHVEQQQQVSLGSAAAGAVGGGEVGDGTVLGEEDDWEEVL